MSYDDGYSEIVRIKDEYRLVDAEDCERTYGAAEARTLQPGYYVAQWPAGTINPHFLHDGLIFIGPFESHRAALSALRMEPAALQPA